MQLHLQVTNNVTTMEGDRSEIPLLRVSGTITLRLGPSFEFFVAGKVDLQNGSNQVSCSPLSLSLSALIRTGHRKSRFNCVT